ncbi:hypothetical protein EG328_008163 [Venturia inaequalis]|uniref:Mitochondrial F1F0 ATP synthase subunit Atp18 n=1 Tax=Venturia inaequalis TaxID=5025 RepID=A0A8H3YRH7_VENIN|nr:hypothetical protein EG328_008163 [Venturia inaequalis]KAE9977612.1 hypothetical protein EG327_007678 [Venturia inaequalis]RDI80090.1 hypothetical protein Vi05172_g9823 [Venturia inaequalis]
MSYFGRKWPVPVAQPMWPFYTAGVVILYGINSFSGLLANTDEFKNDPRNPAAKTNNAAGGH